jgi:hypothetical protein
MAAMQQRQRNPALVGYANTRARYHVEPDNTGKGKITSFQPHAVQAGRV